MWSIQLWILRLWNIGITDLLFTFKERKNRMKIVGMFNPCSTDNKTFVEMVQTAINKLQEDGQEIEIQYSTIGLGGANILYSALILGRK